MFVGAAALIAFLAVCLRWQLIATCTVHHFFCDFFFWRCHFFMDFYMVGVGGGYGEQQIHWLFDLLAQIPVQGSLCFFFQQ